jgi:hypothetical protein
MAKFKSITVPKATYDVINKLKSEITTVPLSTSKVVSIIAQDYRNTHEKERSNDETYLHKKSIIR